MKRGPFLAELADRLRAGLTGRYTIKRELGRGGMAVVFLARDLKYDRPVAIKVLRHDVAAAVGTQRFLREIRTVAQLDHPNIVPLYDSGEAGGSLYYVMPFCAGESLRNRLEREGRLPIADALRIACDVAEALSYAQSHNVVHRDIKPENILLSGGHALVTDFGIARAAALKGRSSTPEGMAVGTPVYMSPEQTVAGGHVDARSDIYSLGCVVYEMLAGEAPFTGINAQVVMARRLQEAPRSLRVIRPEIPQHLEGCVCAALEREPRARPQSAAQFARRLSIAATHA